MTSRLLPLGVVVAIAGCGGAPSTGSQAPVREPEPAVLAALARPPAALPGWVRVKAESGRAPSSIPLPVVARGEGGWRRVRVPHPSGELLRWVAAVDLQPVVTRTATLEAGSARFELRPGAPVDVVATTGERIRIRVTQGRVRVEGDVAAGTIGRVFTPQARWRPSVPRYVLFDDALTVRAAPARNAAVVATVEPAPEYNVRPAWDVVANWPQVVAHAIGPVRDGWREIEVQTRDLVVRGFVRAGSVADSKKDEPTYGILASYFEDAKVRLAPSTCLFDRPGGDVVGATAREDRVPGRVADETGWRWVTLSTAIGPIEVAVVDGAGAPTCPLAISGR